MYQAILRDVNLGSELGEDVFGELKGNGHHIPPIIILSAEEVNELRTAAQKVGAAAILQKPCAWQLLQSTIERVIQAQ